MPTAYPETDRDSAAWARLWALVRQHPEHVPRLVRALAGELFDAEDTWK